MDKIRIDLTIDEDNNITVKNNITGTCLAIDCSDKTINAKDVYDLFCFKSGNKYVIESDINNISNKEVKNYYSVIVELFNDIGNELSELKNNNKDS